MKVIVEITCKTLVKDKLTLTREGPQTVKVNKNTNDCVNVDVKEVLDGLEVLGLIVRDKPGHYRLR